MHHSNLKRSNIAYRFISGHNHNANTMFSFLLGRSNGAHAQRARRPAANGKFLIIFMGYLDQSTLHECNGDISPFLLFETFSIYPALERTMCPGTQLSHIYIYIYQWLFLIVNVSKCSFNFRSFLSIAAIAQSTKLSSV